MFIYFVHKPSATIAIRTCHFCRSVNVFNNYNVFYFKGMFNFMLYALSHQAVFYDIDRISS